MQPIYRAAPVILCRAPARTFNAAPEALQFARQAADDFRVAYQVWEVLRGRLKRMGTFRPGNRRA